MDDSDSLMSEGKHTRVQVLVDIFQAIEDKVEEYSQPLIRVGERVDVGDVPSNKPYAKPGLPRRGI